MPSRSHTHPLILLLALIGLIVLLICGGLIIMPFLWGFVTGNPL
jgi:hypothetical protein